MSSERWDAALERARRGTTEHDHPTHCHSCHMAAQSERAKAKAQGQMKRLTIEMEKANAAARRGDVMPQQCAFQLTVTRQCRETAEPDKTLCRLHWWTE
jgi:hypothetical protein